MTCGRVGSGLVPELWGIQGSMGRMAGFSSFLIQKKPVFVPDSEALLFSLEMAFESQS